MIEFVCTPLPVRIAQQGCHGNHAFSHSLNEFMSWNIFSDSGGGGGGQDFLFGTNEKLSWGCKVGQIGFMWYRVPHFSAILRNCLPLGYSAAHSIFVY